MKNANTRLIVVNVRRNICNIGKFSKGISQFNAPQRAAMVRLLTGPAKAVIAVPSSLRSKLYSLMGTGLLQPKRKRTIEIAPRGSIWARGFRVSLPSALAVGSPSLKAARPWAYSWIVDATRIEGIAKIIQAIVSVKSIMVRL